MKTTFYTTWLSSLAVAFSTLVLVCGSASGGLVLSETFNASDGGFTVTNVNAPFQGPWIYNAVSGTWSTAGQGPELGRAPSTYLTSPMVVVNEAGQLLLDFSHRYAFEPFAWDGGLVSISLNGGQFTPIPGANFTSNGYNGTVLPNSAAEIAGQPAFVEASPGYEIPSFLTSQALGLGSVAVGDSVQLRFVASYDTNTRGGNPAWEITSVSLHTVSIPETGTWAAFMLIGLLYVCIRAFKGRMADPTS